MRVLVIGIIILYTQVCIAQDTVDSEKMILRGKENIQRASGINDIKQLLVSRNHFIDLLSNSQHKELIHYYIGYIDYQLIDNYFFIKDKKNAKKYIYDGIEHLEKAVELKNDFADGHALLSLMYANKAGVKRLSVIGSMKKAFKIIDKALKLAPENPRVLLYAGMINYHMPSIFGAEKEKGLKYLQDSIAAFKTFKPYESVFPDHGLFLAYVQLADIYIGIKDYDRAEKYFDMAQEIKPEHHYVKEFVAKLNKMKKDSH
jgi:tetratricopeptide (TPR) repeat protein